MGGIAESSLIRAHPSLLWHHWEDGSVHVFHPVTGETHLLNAFPGALLEELSESGQTLAAAIDAFTAPLEISPEELRPLLERIVNQLESLELVTVGGG